MNYSCKCDCQYEHLGTPSEIPAAYRGTRSTSGCTYHICDVDVIRHRIQTEERRCDVGVGGYQLYESPPEANITE